MGLTETVKSFSLQFQNTAAKLLVVFDPFKEVSTISFNRGAARVSPLQRKRIAEIAALPFTRTTNINIARFAISYVNDRGFSHNELLVNPIQR